MMLSIDFAVAQLGEGLLVLQELFVVKGFGHRVGEAKDFHISRDKVCLGVCGTHGCCGRGIGSKGRYKSVSIVERQSSIINQWVESRGRPGLRSRRVAQPSGVKWV